MFMQIGLGSLQGQAEPYLLPAEQAAHSLTSVQPNPLYPLVFGPYASESVTVVPPVVPLGDQEEAPVPVLVVPVPGDHDEAPLPVLVVPVPLGDHEDAPVPVLVVPVPLGDHDEAPVPVVVPEVEPAGDQDEAPLPVVEAPGDHADAPLFLLPFLLLFLLLLGRPGLFGRLELGRLLEFGLLLENIPGGGLAFSCSNLAWRSSSLNRPVPVYPAPQTH